MKIVIRIVLVLVVVLVLAVASSYFWLDGAARAAVEAAGSDALGVPVTLDSLSIGIVGGSASLERLNIANPEGCEKPYFFDLQQGSTQVSLKTVMDDTIEIPTLELSGLTVYLEPQKGTGKYNYEVLLDHIAKDEAEPQPEQEGGKLMRIKRLVIRDIRVYYKTKVFVTTPTHVDEIVMTDVGSDGSGVDLGQLTSIVLTGTLKGVASELPAAIGDGLKAGLGKVGEIGGVAVNVVGGGAQAVGGVAKGVVETGAQAVGEGARTIGKGVKGLFGGGDKEEGEGEGEK